VALLLRDREAAPETASPPPNGGPTAGAPDFACEVCGAGMRGVQDWCLECGTAATGRLGSRPGWRAAFTVVGLTLLLVCGAVLASYAALTSDAERTASAPTAGNGNPVVAQAPAAPAAPAAPSAPIQPGATGPGTTPPVVPPGGTPVAPGGPQTSAHPVIPTPRPVVPPSTGAVPPATGKSPAATATPPAAVPPAGAKKPEPQQSASANLTPQIIALKSDAAQTYDPAKRAGAEFGPADNAIDRKLGTVWDVTVPADGNPIGAGLLVNMGAPYALQSLRIATDTPGFRVELYGAVDKAVPADVLDKRWQHLTDAKHVASGEAIDLEGKGDAAKYRQFLVYVTAPAQPTDPRVAISELQLRGTP
jgi:hypothetical protein